MGVPLVTFTRSKASAPLNYTIDLRNQDFLASQSLTSCTIQIISGTITFASLTPTPSGTKVTAQVTVAPKGLARTQWKCVAADGQQFDQPVDFITEDRGE